MLSALRKLRDGLSKTRDGLVRSLEGALGRGRAIDEALLEEIEATLLAGDVGVRATERIVGALRDGARRGAVAGPDDAWALIRREARALLEPPPAAARAAGAARDAATAASATPAAPAARPHVVLVVGVNGVGKTTTIGKLAARYARGGRRVLLAAGDTFRAAAGEQLALWAERAGAEIVRQEKGSDPASVAFDAYARARARDCDVLIVDTAGRLHTKSNLVEELKKVRRVLAKHDPTLPDESLLVLDATTGQNALSQARTFTEAIGLTGIVVTKLDGTSKAGVLLAIGEELRLPVRYIGVGEGIDDLEDFDADAFVAALLGAGA
jgi:fused signal recognition particle receptor